MQRAYIYILEDYFNFNKALIEELHRENQNIKIRSLAIRRRTVCDLIDNNNLPIEKYVWLNDLEEKWLNTPLDWERLKYYENLIGQRNLRHLIICDREFGYGFMSGGIYARTPLRKIIESDPNKRWQYILGMLDYFFKEFTTYKPDFIFLNEITHIWELAIYFVAKNLKIQCLVPYFSRFGDVFVMSDNPYNEFTSVIKCYKKALADPTLVKDYIEESKKYIHSFRERPVLPEYSSSLKKQVLNNVKIRKYLRILLTDIVRIIAIQLGLKGTRKFIRQRNGFDILKENLNVFITNRLALKNKIFETFNNYKNCKYIFYALHYEPEASTMVFADKFTNQLALIEQVAKSLPIGWKLLVKEHIPNTGRRPKNFYNIIKKFPDVHLISPFENTFEMIKKAKVVISITGTTGWESILLKIPTIVFGRTQFNALEEGFVHTNELVHLEAVIEQAQKTPPALDKNLELFVASTIKEGIKLSIEDYAYTHFKSKKHNVIYDSKIIKKFVEKIQGYIN